MPFLWAMVGLALGPFLKLAIYRLPRLERLAAPVTCSQCRERRPAYAASALITTFMGERGRCPGCGAYSARVEVVIELATGVAFWLLALRVESGPKLLLYSFYSCSLIVVFFIDLRHRLILNRITYPGILLAIILTPALSIATLDMALLGAAVGGVTFGVLYAGGYLLYRQEVLGLGDVKLAVMLGAMTGYPVIVLALLLGSFAGALAAGAMLISRRSSGHDFMPYGTALCVGAFATLLLDTSYLP